MKIRFKGSPERERELREVLQYLEAADVGGDYILAEKTDERISFSAEGEMIWLFPADIFAVESFGHDIYICTERETYVTHTPVCEMEKVLSGHDFLRVSQSVIVNLRHVLKRSAYLAGRCFITLENGKEVTVTRTYYKKSKEEMKR